MAKIECYTPEGKMEMKEPVDAKEAVEYCGYMMEPIETEKTPEEKKLDKMNKNELIAKAESLEIGLEGSENKAELLAKIESKIEEED